MMQVNKNQEPQLPPSAKKFQAPARPDENMPSEKKVPWKFQEEQKFHPNQIQYVHLDQNAKPYRAVVTLARSKGTYTNIQEAINAVNRVGGGIVYIKTGTYVLSDNITLFNNVHLLGEDFYNTVIDCGTANNQFLVDSRSNVSIDNLTIQNGRSPGGTIYITNSNTINIRNVYFLNNTAVDGSGIDIFVDNIGGAGVLINISLCLSKGAGQFVYLRGNDIGSWFTNNRIISPLAEAFFGDISSGGSGYFIANEFVDCPVQIFYGLFRYSRFTGNISYFNTQVSTNFQVDLRTGSQNILLSNNHFSLGGHGGLRLTSASIIQVNGNNIAAGGSVSAVEMDTVQESQIAGNTISAFGTLGGNGILIDASSLSQITGNYISNIANNVDGVLLRNATNNIQITGNMIYERGTSGTAYAINILGTSSYNNLVVGNRLIGFTGGTSDTGTGDSFTGNL